MSENEKKFLDKLSENVSQLPEEKKEYVLGMTEGMALMKKDRQYGLYESKVEEKAWPEKRGSC